jgi:glycosyltransferase involved in cell wall biosynthesis
MIKKKLTILIATYNGELYIAEQLDSILNQSFQEYMIICRDDISTDNTFSILHSYQKKYPNIIKVSQNKERLGVVSNFEKLIEDSSSEYMALCDQDDIWHKDKLRISMNALESRNQKIPLLFHSDLVMVDSNLKLLNSSFFKKRGYAFPKEKSLDIFLGRSGVMGNTMVFNKNLKNSILPFPKSLIVHDYWIALVNEAIGERISYHEALIDYRLHSNNTSFCLRKYHSKNFLDKNMTLPYQHIAREDILKEFLNRINLENKDIIITKHFIDYLDFKRTKLYIISLVFKYNFFRNGLFYKLKLIGAILWKTR